MKLKFTTKAYQTAAVEAVADCFLGQPKKEGIKYRLDPGRASKSQKQGVMAYDVDAYRNHEIALTPESILENVKSIQRSQNLPVSDSLVETPSSPINLDIEMETGTGKTYCYIKSIFELNRRYGWSKFVIVVPSIAIREGVQKSLEITAEHFLADYQKKARFFTYNSKQLHNLESFSSDAGINVMVINVQAFNSPPQPGAAARTVLSEKNRIYRELDDFQTRRPIDIIKANRPILILDEPQKMEGAATKKSLAEFNALCTLRYSATHRTEHNKIHRLDALDAYNQKLVKKISVHGIAQKGLTGTDSYLYLEGIQISKSAPVARIELEIQSATGTIKRTIRRISSGDNLHELSGGLNQYEGYVVSEINAQQDRVTFTNGQEINVGKATGDINETALRRIQIREAIRAHLEKERALYHQGIKVLTLFFIDEVAKYRLYDEEGNPTSGEYAQAFQEEYNDLLNEYLELEDSPFQSYLKGIDSEKTHNGYFSVDKKGKLTDPKVKARGEDAGLTDDISAYDLIMKDKERLLSFAEPTRFIFSHSALREGWDNPNIFVICTLKHSDNTISRRQEVGRGMRLCVNQTGERLDDPAIAHEINRLTVVANESYEDFVKGLQSDLKEGLSKRPQKADQKYFEGKTIIDTEGAQSTIDATTAKKIHRYLIKNDYVDDEKDTITEDYHEDKANESLAELPEELRPFSDAIFKLIDAVYSDAALPEIEDDRATKENALNQNFQKKEFQELWSRINHRAAYTVDFDSEELIKNATSALNEKLRITKLQFQLKTGEQQDELDQEDLTTGQGFTLKERSTQYNEQSVRSTVEYDLVGEVAANTQLTRRTIGTILRGLKLPIFNQFKVNPEDFITKASQLIKEQKATVIVEHLTYDAIGGHYDSAIFTSEKKADLSKAYKANNHIYDYVFTDSKAETKFAEALDTSTEVTVYAKLPRGFSIPTPVGDYNPDWAIAFVEGSVKHIYFIAETKGSMSSLQLREIEKSKISCAKKFFAKVTSGNVHYDVVDSYENLIDLVSA